MSKQIKKQIPRQVLGHPLRNEHTFEHPKKEEQLKALIPQLLSHVFPPSPNRSALLAALPAGLEPKAQFAAVREQRREIRRAVPENHDLKEHLAVGLKKCLRDLNQGLVDMVVFDPDALPDPVQTMLLSYEKPAVIAVKNLMQLSRTAFGFSSLIFGLKRLTKDSRLSAFHSVCLEIKSQSPPKFVDPKSLPGEGRRVAAQDPGAEKRAQAAQPTEEAKPRNYLLKRKGTERVFRPPLSTACSTSADFGSDFIGLGGASEAKEVAAPTGRKIRANAERMKRHPSKPYQKTRMIKTMVGKS